MKAPVDKKKNEPEQASTSQKVGTMPVPFFVDNRPEAIAQRKMQEKADNSPQAKKNAQLQAKADRFSNGVSIQNKVIQPKEKANRTGLPDHLKSGIENLSGISMDDVKVHRNSPEPAQLNAHAYAQGTNIHLGPGQEKHLPHEAWHVVQQKQGRVKPTMQMKGSVNVNDDTHLEKEADVMGAKASSRSNIDQKPVQKKKSEILQENDIIQGVFWEYEDGKYIWHKEEVDKKLWIPKEDDTGAHETHTWHLGAYKKKVWLNKKKINAAKKQEQKQKQKTKSKAALEAANQKEKEQKNKLLTDGFSQEDTDKIFDLIHSSGIPALLELFELKGAEKAKQTIELVELSEELDIDTNYLSVFEKSTGKDPNEITNFLVSIKNELGIDPSNFLEETHELLKKSYTFPKIIEIAGFLKKFDVTTNKLFELATIFPTHNKLLDFLKKITAYGNPTSEKLDTILGLKLFEFKQSEISTLLNCFKKIGGSTLENFIAIMTRFGKFDFIAVKEFIKAIPNDIDDLSLWVEDIKSDEDLVTTRFLLLKLNSKEIAKIKNGKKAANFIDNLYRLVVDKNYAFADLLPIKIRLDTSLHSQYTSLAFIIELIKYENDIGHIKNYINATTVKMKDLLDVLKNAIYSEATIKNNLTALIAVAKGDPERILKIAESTDKGTATAILDELRTNSADFQRLAPPGTGWSTFKHGHTFNLPIIEENHILRRHTRKHLVELTDKGRTSVFTKNYINSDADLHSKLKTFINGYGQNAKTSTGDNQRISNGGLTLIVKYINPDFRIITFYPVHSHTDFEIPDRVIFMAFNNFTK